jgi:hypothetical protein
MGGLTGHRRITAMHFSDVEFPPIWPFSTVGGNAVSDCSAERKRASPRS